MSAKLGFKNRADTLANTLASKLGNQFKYCEDEEHKKSYVIPSRDDIVKTVSLVHYAPDLFMPTHVHSVGQFSTLISGQALETNINAEINNTLGIAEFKPVAYKHSNRIGPNGALFLSINLNTEHEAFVSEYGKLGWQLTDKSATKNVWNSLSKLLLTADPSCNLDLEEIVFDLLSGSLTDQHTIKQAPNWLLLAEQALNETDMNIQQIADDIGVHRVHLSRIFQSHFSLSISEYRQRIALQKSITAMLNDDESISLAGAGASFSDQSHLTRVMKKQLGVTPKTLKSGFSSTLR